MISTLEIKIAQINKGFLTIGDGPQTVLIMGSCRVAPYVWYMKLLNEMYGNKYTIHTLDPFNWNWDHRDQRVDSNKVIDGLEDNEAMLEMIKSVDIFLHEYYQNFGMFNTFKNEGKSIYNFGMQPAVDICIPSWNDVFLLFNDIVSFDLDMRKKATQDFNVLGKLSEQTENEIFDIGTKNLDKFYQICRKSDIPQAERFFEYNLPRKRLFHTYNHVSKHFTFGIFIEIMTRLGIQPEMDFCQEILKEDMFDSHYTKLTSYDVKWYGLDWKEPIVSLREKL